MIVILIVVHYSVIALSFTIDQSINGQRTNIRILTQKEPEWRKSPLFLMQQFAHGLLLEKCMIVCIIVSLLCINNIS